MHVFFSGTQVKLAEVELDEDEVKETDARFLRGLTLKCQACFCIGVVYFLTITSFFAVKHGLATDVLKYEGTKGGRNVAEQMSNLVVYTEAVKFKV